MADFCAQCSAELGAPSGWSDFDYRAVEPQPSIECAHIVLCEGCGVTVVDFQGACIANCTKHHKPTGDTVFVLSFD